jgi:hypothetical protein
MRRSRAVNELCDDPRTFFLRCGSGGPG